MSLSSVRWLPRPRSIKRRPGNLNLPSPALIELSAPARRLAGIIRREWPSDTKPRTVMTDETGFRIRIGVPNRRHRPITPACPDKAEHYTVDIKAHGIMVEAMDYRGLLYGWQTVKQLLREYPGQPLPCMYIVDGPDIGWRVYHIDLKGTRRTRANLYRLAERLAELRINALMVEYEDYFRLERHPDLAIDNALEASTVKAWIGHLKRYGIDVIPLVQTLGHWQYVLTHPKYMHLRELPDLTSDGCPLHPGTWELARDFIDEIIDLHPDAPIIHVGLDETALLGRCPRCKRHLGKRPPIALYIEWLNRVTDYVRSRGHTPMAWADKLVHELDGPNLRYVRQVHPGTVFLDWNYGAIGPRARGLDLDGHRVSRQWLNRPDQITDTWPLLNFGPNSDTFDSLPTAALRKARTRFINPSDPRWIRNFDGAARLRALGFDVFGGAGLRVSFHGCVAPRFLTAQFNAIAWADAARRYKLSGVIGTSWSRGHSWAGMNAHPELDWYAVATLADACWTGLSPEQLPDFDRRFAFQFFGLPNGDLGDALGLIHRSSQSADHLMDNYTGWIRRLLKTLRPKVMRNRDVFSLLQAIVDLQTLRLDLSFPSLEAAYFTALWERVPDAFKADMRKGIRRRLMTAESRCAKLKRIYSKALIDEDAKELAETQLRFLINQLSDLERRLFPD